MLNLPFTIIPSPYTQEEIQAIPLSVRIGLSRMPGYWATPAHIASEQYALDHNLPPPATRMIGNVYMTPEEYDSLGDVSPYMVAPAVAPESEPAEPAEPARPRGRPPIHNKDTAKQDAIRAAYDAYLLRCKERKDAAKAMEEEESELALSIRVMRKRHAAEMAELIDLANSLRKRNKDYFNYLTNAIDEAAEYHRFLKGGL